MLVSCPKVQGWGCQHAIGLAFGSWETQTPQRPKVTPPKLACCISGTPTKDPPFPENPSAPLIRSLGVSCVESKLDPVELRSANRYVCMHGWMDACMYMHIYTYTHVCMYVCMYVCMSVCMYAYICTSMYTYIYIHIEGESEQETRI